MALEIKDKNGRTVGTVVHREDTFSERFQANIKTDGQNASLIFLIAGFILVIGPLFGPSLLVYDYLEGLGVHALFRLLIAALPLVVIIYSLYRFRIARAAYIALLSIYLSAILLHFVEDKVWAVFFSILLIAAGGFTAKNIYAGDWL
jgi:hypothetical protein